MRFWRDIRQVKSPALWLALIRITTGWIFLESGLGKLSNPGFAGSMGKTLEKFLSENPYPWMADLLRSVAIPNAGFFGVLIPWAEVLVGISLLFGILSEAGLLGALALNLTFYFAAGWTSPSTSTANEIMAVADVAMLFGMAGRVLSVDQVLAGLYARVLPWRRRRTAAGAQTA